MPLVLMTSGVDTDTDTDTDTHKHTYQYESDFKKPGAWRLTKCISCPLPLILAIQLALAETSMPLK